MSSENERSEYEKFLLDDIKSIYGFQHHLLNSRAIIIGASLALMGAIITYTRTKVDNATTSEFTICCTHALLMGICFATILIIGAMNRAQFVFGAYIAAVQNELKRPAFWTSLFRYLDATNHTDTITHGFALCAKLMSLAMSLYVIASSLDYGHLQEWQDHSFRVLGFSAAGGTVLAGWTYWHVHQRVDTTNFKKEIIDRMQEIVTSQIQLAIKPETSTCQVLSASPASRVLGGEMPLIGSALADKTSSQATSTHPN